MSPTISQVKIINLPFRKEAEWRTSLPKVINELNKETIHLDCKDWYLNCTELKKLIFLIEDAGLTINLIQSKISETVVSASALGYEAHLSIEPVNEKIHSTKTSPKYQDQMIESNLFFHQGTIRSGEQLESEGDLLLHGDVNPGAIVSAVGNVMVWGRLRGTAHAGNAGNNSAKICALQLRPLQLRIASAVARGPQEKPEAGFAEEAIIKNGQIIIQPLQTS